MGGFNLPSINIGNITLGARAVDLPFSPLPAFVPTMKSNGGGQARMKTPHHGAGGNDNVQTHGPKQSSARSVHHCCCHHAEPQPVDTPETQQPTDFADMDGVDGNTVQNENTHNCPKPKGKTIHVDQKYLDEHDGVVKGGDGDDTFIIDGDLKGVKIEGGKGDDKVIVNGSLTDAKINLGEGNDTVKINGEAKDVKINLGKGKDKFINNGDVSDAKINLGKGDDTAKNNGTMDDVKLNAGAGDDKGINNGTIKNSVIDGGAGNNTGKNNGTLTDNVLKNWSSAAAHNCDDDPAVEEPSSPPVEEPETPDTDDCGCPGEEEPVVAIKDGARIWGDPHFVGADGGKFDVQGEAGKTYNLLSDEGIQVNGKFEGSGNGITTIGEAGVVLDGHNIKIGKDGSLEIDGEKQEGNGEFLDGKVTKEGNKVTIKDEEYDITFNQNGGNIDINFASENVNADGVMPHGLFGQTADGDGEARNGDTGKGTQGGGAIDNMFDNRTEAGDKTTVGQYEVADLFDTDFTNFNRYD